MAGLDIARLEVEALELDRAAALPDEDIGVADGKRRGKEEPGGLARTEEPEWGGPRPGGLGGRGEIDGTADSVEVPASELWLSRAL